MVNNQNKTKIKNKINSNIITYKNEIWGNIQTMNAKNMKEIEIKGKNIYADTTSQNKEQNTQITYISPLENENISLKKLIDNCKLSEVSARGLHYIISKFTTQVKHNERDLNVLYTKGRVDITLTEYMNVFKLKDRKSAREQFKTFIYTISHICVSSKNVRCTTFEEVTTKNKKKRIKKIKTEKDINCVVFQTCTTQKKGKEFKASFLLNSDLALYIASSKLYYYPPNLYELDLKRHSKALLLTTYLYNLAQETKPHNTITLKSILLHCKFIELMENEHNELVPNLEEKRYKKLIYKPIKDTLEYLVEEKILLSYKFDIDSNTTLDSLVEFEVDRSFLRKENNVD